MAERVRVTSLEAIEAFRAKLVIYRDKAGRVLDEVNDDVIRTRMWLQSDRVTHWRGQIDRRTKELRERQQELFSAQLGGLRDASYVQQAAVQKAKGALRDAEARLQVVKQWNRQFDQRVEPLARQVEKLRHDIGHDLGIALAWLSEVTKTLSAYAELSATGATAKPASGENANPADAPEPAKGGAQP